MSLSEQLDAQEAFLSKKLWQQCLFLLGTIGLLAVGKALLTEYTIAVQRPDAILVNISGRQRMLSQNIANTSGQLARTLRLGETQEASKWHKSLVDLVAEFKTFHHAVSTRNYEFGFSGKHTQDVAERFNAIEHDFENLVSNTEEFLKVMKVAIEEEILPEGTDHRLDKIAMSANSYLSDMNLIVKGIETHALENLEQTQLASWFGVFGTVILLLMVAMFVLAPAIRHVTQQHEEVVDLNHTLKDTLKETATINVSLRESLDLNDAIFDTAADGLILLDEKLKIIRANKKAAEMLDVRFEKDSPVSIYNFFCDKDGVKTWTSIEEIINSTSRQIICNSVPVKLRRGKSDSFHAELSLSRVGEFNSKHYTAIIRDTTDRDQLQDQLRQAEKMASLGRLSAGVAHEINTPMQCISLNINYIATMVDGLLESEDITKATEGSHSLPNTEQPLHTSGHAMGQFKKCVSSAIEDVSSAMDQVADIVKAMKSLSHPNASDLKEVNINELVHDAVSLSKNVWKHSSELQLDLDPDIPDAELVAVGISQGIINLINNASDAIVMKYGIKSGHGKIIIATRMKDENLVISVKDNGPGIPEEAKERVFEQFFTTKEVGKGTGLGLAFCYDVIVHGHQGQIYFESERGQGTTFYIELPIHNSLNVPEEELASTG